MFKDLLRAAGRVEVARCEPVQRIFLMRISGGEARGITLRVPKGDAVRPATDGMRQAVFSSIAARVPGAMFLDLFAGSGAYGLEALSRGASGGYFVEKNNIAVGCLRQNLSAVCKSVRRTENDFKVAASDVLSWSLPAGSVAPDLVFVDPPYSIIQDMAPRLFARLDEMLREKNDSVVAFEMPGEMEIAPLGWTAVKRLGKGVRQPTVTFFRKTSSL